jgi:hypothetical protein
MYFSLTTGVSRSTNRKFVLWIRQIITGASLKLDNSILPKERHDLTLFLVQLASSSTSTESNDHGSYQS